jgi:hypothetical protein
LGRAAYATIGAIAAAPSQTGLAARKAAAFRTSIRLGEAVEAFGYPLTEVLSKSGNFTLATSRHWSG